MKKFLIAFESTHAAMAAQKALSSIGSIIIPTPRAISAGCGMSLCFEAVGSHEAIALGLSVEDARGLATLYEVQAGEYQLLQKL